MESKNTFYYKKSIIINQKEVDFVPEVGDEFYIKEDKLTAIGGFVDYAKPEPEKKLFVTDDFNKDVVDMSGWEMCRPIELGGKKYGMVGCRNEGVGHFFLYELV